MHDGWAVEAASLALDGSPDVLEGRATVRKASKRGVVHVELDVRVTVTRPCDRCGDDTTLEVHTDSQLLYAPEDGGDASLEGEIELDAEDLDLGWYPGGAIRMADVLREALALELPTRVVCADTAECDRRTDALLAASKADESTGHPGFAVLKDLG
jgi:uncharacterized metal-binding protein YceD (DUF177 family)